MTTTANNSNRVTFRNKLENKAWRIHKIVVTL